MNWYFVGLDLGQSQDPTALAVVERREAAGEFDGAVFAYRKEVTLWVRHLERVKLGTPYPEVVERVVEVTQSRQLSGRCTLIVDGTGVGRPVVDLLRRAKPECSILPVLITGGELETMDQGYYRVPKKDLICGMQMLMENDELRIAAGMAEAPRLVEEMMEMRVRQTEAGREQFGVWRKGKHDDLVLATALACWAVKKVRPAGAWGEPEYVVNRDEREWARRFQWEIDRVMRRVGAGR